jgi:5-methylcytosine-specific restriction endonuclease McrA
MPNDPFYRTEYWRRIRTAILRRDRYVCVVPGCGRRATVVDHIHPRRSGGVDSPSNLRSLCAMHDGQVKERSDGRRFNEGKLILEGVDRRGIPLDPGHHWHQKKA